MADSSAGLDNGRPDGFIQFGAPIALSDSDPIGWASLAFMPPYCFTPSCIAGPALRQATSARLGSPPEQMILRIQNQVDLNQQRNWRFPSMTDWTNALRAAYCQNQGRTGLRYFMPAQSSPIHGIILNSRFYDLTSVGVSVRDWLWSAMQTPDQVTDLVEEGSLVQELGVDPFACPVN
ncbi:MAG: hypothetical protein D6815_12940 [Candidatus Dadabacteria bacterium]|nr:MAG: hypothetical protein D6815_12940 [Candidatus Dadabacteria bacterium]